MTAVFIFNLGEEVQVKDRQDITGTVIARGEFALGDPIPTFENRYRIRMSPTSSSAWLAQDAIEQAGGSVMPSTSPACGSLCDD